MSILTRKNTRHSGGAHGADRRIAKLNKAALGTAQPVGWIPPAERPIEPAPQLRQLPRRKRRLVKSGAYEIRPERHITSTRQGEVLNIALSSKSAKLHRTIAGKNMRTGGVATIDEFDSYADPTEPQFTSTITVVKGAIGSGKSTVLKSLYVVRQILRGNYAVVLDKKPQSDVGEYGPLAKALGTEPVMLRPGGGPGASCINLIDPRIALGTDESTARQTIGQYQLVTAVLERALGRQLEPTEAEAVRLALIAAPKRAAAEAREPVVRDLIWALQHPDRDLVAGEYDQSWSTRMLYRWGIAPAAALLGLIHGPLGGIIDGPTSEEVSLNHRSRLTVFDISKIPTTGPAMGIVMLLIQTWLASLLAQRSSRSQKTVLVIEEGWHIATGSIGAMFKENALLSRALGLLMVIGIHHDTQITGDARALLQDSQTKFLFRESDPDDITQTLRAAGLSPGLAGLLADLPRGRCLLVRAGQDPEEVQILISEFEKKITDTDGALVGDEDAIDADEQEVAA